MAAYSLVTGNLWTTIRTVLTGCMIIMLVTINVIPTVAEWMINDDGPQRTNAEGAAPVRKGSGNS